MGKFLTLVMVSVLTLTAQGPGGAQTIPGPDRKAGEGQGPFRTMVVRGVMMIDGTGAPPQGPVDIVVSYNRHARR